jgi:nicotinate-nucleotide adenylyltransferase
MIPDTTGRRLRVGMYGGTFDPIHRGHLSVAEIVRRALDLDQVVFVPAQRSPLKFPPQAPPHDRVAMVRLAVAHLPWASVSTSEVDRPPPSFTVDTLRDLDRQTEHADLYLIVGADVFAELPLWRDLAGILDLATIVAVGRPNVPLVVPSSLESLRLERPERLVLIECATPPISSRQLRATIALGEGTPNEQLDAVVARYIDEHCLYRETTLPHRREA